MRRATILALGVAAAAAAAASLVVAGRVGRADADDDPLDGVRAATRQYRKVERAIDAGYVQFFGCVHEPLAGSMGIHFVNGALAGDAVIDAADARGADVRGAGRTASWSSSASSTSSSRTAWDAANAAPPELFGQTFNVVEEPNRYGIPTVLRAARLGLEAQPDRRPRGLEPHGALPRHRGPHALTASALVRTRAARGSAARVRHATPPITNSGGPGRVPRVWTSAASSWPGWRPRWPRRRPFRSSAGSAAPVTWPASRSPDRPSA